MKRTALFIVLGVAFAAVSLWYLLSAGRSKRATRLKYRLGGALLSIMAITSTGCGKIMPTCYDVYVPEPEPEAPVYKINLINQDATSTITIRNGDLLVFQFDSNTNALPHFIVIGSDNRVIQDSKGEGDDHQSIFTLDVGDYVGEAKLNVWWKREGETFVYSSEHICNLNIVASEEN